MSTEESLQNAHGIMIDDDLANIQFKPIWNHNYAHWFQEIQYNGKTLSGTERKKFIDMINETIARYSDGIPLMHNTLVKDKDLHDKYHELERSIVSSMFFVLITMIDSLVATKYFMLADTDYDRRFMRGKLKVILNEGFKRLYGFGTKSKNRNYDPEWAKLEPLMEVFPPSIQNQYRVLTNLLRKHAKATSWWKNERDNEVHLDVENLYSSRQEEIVESEVMIDSMKLFSSLLAVNDFLFNLHTCLYNFLVAKYKRGELKEE